MNHQLLLVVGAALAIMVAASVFSRRTGIATPLLLAVLGIGASYLPGAPTVDISPEVVLAGVLPALLYASAVNLPVLDVRRNVSLIGWLSIVMVVVSAVVIGAVVHLLFSGIPFALGVALGAVVSPTDAVAATAIGRRLGLPPRLMTVLEGESLVNDASALVVLRTATAALTAAGGLTVWSTAVDFVWAVAGAVGIGLAVGWLTVLLRQRLDDPVLNTTISFAVPFLAFVPAEEAGVSGVLAVVVAGLVTGTLGSRRFSARDRQTQATTWTTASFVLESAVFLGMGYQLPQLLEAAHDETTVGRISALVVVVVALLLVLRFVGLLWPALTGRAARGSDRGEALRARYDAFEEKLDAMSPPADEREASRLGWARRRLARGRADVDFEQREPITGRGYLVLAWAGMRGVVTVAAAQTIPEGTPQRATVVLAAFLVALVTLVLFGLTLPWLIARMDFRSADGVERRDAVQALLRQVGESAVDAVGPVEEQTIDGEPVDPALASRLREEVLPRLLAGAGHLDEHPGAVEQMLILQRRYLDAMRDALLTERDIGAYPSDTYKRVEAMLDTVEHRLDRS
ncbi:sodium:proton antiporter [Phycicoccus endophyticus]|uniref:Sodium:proton antiporter n=1 Tax=Phycicoccus endophyticus TaxID=1690220 RepID=A0A7G9R201_9MICO|nr:sodium:proton antiporter [Phycicoccus endophyticus]NHI19742.1 sodium:proton antiporter [Phycicoccus endophyticus]QNN49626.1 sodium:proton antiporter [Phycicoccus endophyticus]GGL33450.1 peptidase [Phycicoccus endophyticus]